MGQDFTVPALFRSVRLSAASAGGLSSSSQALICSIEDKFDCIQRCDCMGELGKKSKR